MLLMRHIPCTTVRIRFRGDVLGLGAAGLASSLVVTSAVQVTGSSHFAVPGRSPHHLIHRLNHFIPRSPWMTPESTSSCTGSARITIMNISRSPRLTRISFTAGGLSPCEST
jgi:hypothetical protein